MANLDYEALCKELHCCNSHVVAITLVDLHKRPLFEAVKVLNYGCTIIHGTIMWGLWCVYPDTQKGQFFAYNDIVGYLKDGKVKLDGLDRCLENRFGWMDRMEKMQTYEFVETMVEDLAI